MSVGELFVWILALGLSAVSAGLFLHAGRRASLTAALAAMAVGGGAMWVLPGEWSLAAGLVAGLPPAAFCLAWLGKLTPLGGVLGFLISGSCLGMAGAVMRTVRVMAGSGAGAPVWLCAVFALLHLPAVLLSAPAFSLPADRLAGLRGEDGGVRAWHLAGIAGLMLVLIQLVLPLLDGTGAAELARPVLAAALLWAGLAVMVLLAAYAQKREESSAESDFRQDMATFFNLIRSQRHDYNLHVQTVAGLIARQQWEECRRYVDALVQDTAGLNAILQVRDPAVAALIGYYRTVCARQGIGLTVDVRHDMTQLRTNTYETNKILGNLLQNALDETLRLPNPAGAGIELEVFKRGENCLIRVSNPVADPADFARRQQQIFHQGYTTKQGHDGVGLSSIRVLARRVGGEVSVWLEEDTVHFVASLPMDSTPAAPVC